MSNLPELQKRHEQRLFRHWDGQLPMTVEREDICEELRTLVDLCGK
jgi:hypothetical protein